MKNQITVSALIEASPGKVWECLTNPIWIMFWNKASDDWICSWAQLKLKKGGRFLYRMEAKDESAKFDFSGVFDHVYKNRRLYYTLDDGRQVQISLTAEGDKTRITEIFEAENINSIEQQRVGWQAILDNMKKVTENPPKLKFIPV